MKLFDVYPLYNINIVKGDGIKVWDENGTEYLEVTLRTVICGTEYISTEVMPLSSDTPSLYSNDK